MTEISQTMYCRLTACSCDQMKVLSGSARPFRPVRDAVVFKAPDCDLCAKAGVKAPVKRQQLFRRTVAGLLAIGFQNQFAHPGRAEPLALKRHERQIG